MTVVRNGSMLVLAGALCAALTGCVGGSDAQPTPPATPTPSPTSSPSPTPPAGPTLPPAPEPATGKKGAKAFVRYYWDVVNYAQATGDTEVLKTLGVDECDSCNVGIETIENNTVQGAVVTGGHLTPRRLTPRHVSTGSLGEVWSIGVVLDNTDQTVTYPDKVQRFPATTITISMAAVQRAGTWTLTDWTVL